MGFVSFPIKRVRTERKTWESVDVEVAVAGFLIFLFFSAGVSQKPYGALISLMDSSNLQNLM